MSAIVNDNRTLFARDTNADGAPEYREIAGYDTNGNQVFREVDDNGNGIVDRRDIYNYTLVNLYRPV